MEYEAQESVEGNLILLFRSMKEILEFSSQYNTWALAVFAGSVAAIVTNSYHRPVNLKWRLPNFLFPIGWILLLMSWNAGNEIKRSYLAAIVVRKYDQADRVMENINSLVGEQIKYFNYSIWVFGAWLCFALLAWMFANFGKKGE